MNKIDSLDVAVAKEYLDTEFEHFKQRFSEVEESDGPYKEIVTPFRANFQTFALGKKGFKPFKVSCLSVYGHSAQIRNTA